MTEDQILDDLIIREGGFVDDPADKGGATKYGITAKTLGAWRRMGRPATRAEVEKLTIEEARAIYRKRYLEPFDKVLFTELRAQLVDMGVLQGPYTAIAALQSVLGVEQDGIIGEKTLAALRLYPWRLVHNALVAKRMQELVGQVAGPADPDYKWLLGWMRRASSFYVERV